jgi:hypothetical protein
MGGSKEREKERERRGKTHKKRAAENTPTVHFIVGTGGDGVKPGERG